MEFRHLNLFTALVIVIVALAALATAWLRSV